VDVALDAPALAPAGALDETSKRVA
jgi:hypothetical protein